VTLRRDDGREQTFVIVGEMRRIQRTDPSHIYLRSPGQRWGAQ
jgi:hypothetical protein